MNVVLLSGGIDSATALAMLSEEPTLDVLHIAYGQAAALEERAASRRLADYYGVSWRCGELSGREFGVGEIRGRNAFLLHAALLFFHGQRGTVTLGVHAGTGYADCGLDFIALMQRSYDFHSEGQIRISTPLLNFTKPEVFKLAVDLEVPLQLTYSCEAGGTPTCGSCLSCLDREAIGART